MRERLSLSRLAWNHIEARGGRSALLMLLITLLAAALLTGAVLSLALQNGLGALADRLGADLIVVPSGHDGKVSGALLRGEPARFYMEETVLERLRDLPGIQMASPQLYIATLSESCCSMPLQIIGYEPESDFSVGPWIYKSLGRNPVGDEIVVGAAVNAKVDGELKFFNRTFKVIARLEKTGMGFDSSVFMAMGTARDLLQHDAMKTLHPAVDYKVPISTVLLRLEVGADTRETIFQINEHFRGEQIYALNTENMMRELAGTMRSLRVVLMAVVVLFWLLATLALLLVFSTILRERAREFRIYRMLGAKIGYLERLLFCEALYISALGSAAGLLLGILFCVFFGQILIAMLALPSLMPSWPLLAGIGLMAFVLATLTGPLASLHYIKSLRQYSVEENLREEC